MTRRELVKGAVAAAALSSGLAGGRAGTSAAASFARAVDAGSGGGQVAVIGAGAGGIAAAYFVSDVLGVDLFEARPKIGGHCDSRVIDYQGESVTVDLGAQFFHPDTHPIYVALLEQVGLYDPAHPDTDDTLQAPGSLCIFRTGPGVPVFSSSHPLATPARSLEFAVFAELARNAVISNMPWETTLDSWIAGLSVSASFKSEVAYPWITSLIGCSRADAGQASARSILQTFALSFPADVLQGATTYNSTIGLEGNLQRLLDLSPSVRVHLSTPVQALALETGGWFLQTPAGRLGPYSAVVMNATPLSGRQLLAPLLAFANVASALAAYQYFDSRLLIHTDPAYVYPDRGDWAAYNAEIDGPECEGSVWLGALDPKLPSGATVDVFKSWAERRRTQPTQVLLERRFKHPLITQSMLQGARALRPLQGQGGLYFSGVYTTGFDSQESAVYSAMQVAEALTPSSQTLASLKALLAAQGLAGISYDL